MIMKEAEVEEQLPKIWPYVFLRGLVPAIIGALMLYWPSGPATFYAYLFGTYVFIDGVLLVIQTYIMGKADVRRRSRLLHGSIGIVVGTAVFLLPWVSNIRLVTLFSGYEIVTGILQSMTAFDIRKAIENDELVIIGGLISIVIGALLSIRPMDSLSDLVKAIGLFLIVYGIIVVVLSLRSRKMAEP